ncbi:hypothetical protein DXG01_014926 [Tephrocybe rancida]|nr:hypothetical protein DXG01_014926 [Tephrocybe rancida]
MEYTSSSKSLREMPPIPQQVCTCGMPGRDIEVIVVHFDNLEKTILTICPCLPAPRQLIQHGCFALAPLEPTLAVDFKVLDFVSTLLLHVAPNNTGWTDTVETFLAKQGYKLAAEGSLRKRFGNALVWYNVLQDATTRHVDQVLRIARRLDVEIDDGMDISQEFEEDDPFLSPSHCNPLALPTTAQQLRTMKTTLPSQLLDSNTHPRTIFIPEQDVEAMDKYVEFIRAKKAPAKKRTNVEEHDHIEGSLHVPKSVLDGCEAGFTAADSRREKASMQFFDDTALMALLCHHDVVLFIANM